MSVLRAGEWTCPGYVVDHVRPLASVGADAPSNMQWQTGRCEGEGQVGATIAIRGRRKIGGWLHC